jgi:hypothetical protein
VAETTVKRLLCCGFWRTSKATGQLYQCWWRICQKINVFPGLNITFYILYPSVTYLLMLPCTSQILDLNSLTQWQVSN